MTRGRPKHRRSLEDFARIASDWFWETDADHRFSYFTDQLEASVGRDRAHLIGQTRCDLAGKDRYTPRWIAHAEDLAHRRPFRNFEYYTKRDDGRILWVRVSGEPFYHSDGSFAGYRGCGQNVTDEKLTIARLEASNAALQLRNQQLSEARQALERSAFEDALTEVWNRRAFERDLNDMLACTDRNLGLLHIDLDRFKWINDTLGHQSGDTVLKLAATRIRLATGALGTTYRVGGDEFMVILCDHVTQDMATTLGHQITNAMSAPISVGCRSVQLSASVGVAVCEGADMDGSTLVSEADAALYEAKSRGRNAVCAITDQLRHRLEGHRRIATDLPDALKHDQLIPYFQPQYDLINQEIIGVETLVRWQHPTRGVIGPKDFLSVAAELGVSDQIDRVMLKKGLATVARLAKMGLALPSISINTSKARLMDPRLISDVGCEWTTPGCRLSLELLETIYLDDCCDRRQLFTHIDRLRAMGVRIETDDFGSARASITGLLKVAPHRLKIDRRLVQNVVSDPDKRSIVRAILELARSLRIDCMAEGAEDQQALDLLQSMGCTQVQGYAISAPLSEADLISFLRQNTLAPTEAVQVAQTQTAGHVGLPQSA